VDAVELNGQVVGLVEEVFGAYSGRPYSAPGVRLHLAEARGFVAGNRERFDLIQVALLDAFGASSAGLYALSESYLYTAEALRDYLERLAPGGMLAITRWVGLPPRDTLKLFGTAIAALRARGATEPGRQLALIRSWKTVTLLVAESPFTPAQVEAIRAFCRARSFDADHLPGMPAGGLDRYNLLDRPYFSEGAAALLGPAPEDFVERYKFDIRPATDDRPYFFQSFRWRTLPELIAVRSQGGLPLIDWGYPVLVATLAQAVLVGLALILLPLAASRRTRQAASRAAAGLRWRAAAYFLALGLGFMFVEIAFIQKFILFLHHPLYAVAVVLFAFLLFAALGSRTSARLPRTARRLPFLAVAGLAAAYLAVLPPVFALLMPLPDAGRIAVSVLLVGPLAFAMGMPFPLGLVALAERAEDLVPWAWGINGFASVVAAILATLLAIHFGFRAVVLLAAVLYLGAAFVFPAAPGREPAAGAR
ncbi:MAG TPA: hypothetical protein VN279_07530, partial [Rhodocyclaceae bacterium]|nr:hypothetical protein [Rhodocyclaceae bacterium]